MRIIVNDFAASSGGAISILKSFYNYIIESKDENEWFFLLSDNHITDTNTVHTVLLTKEKASRFRRLLFDFLYGRYIVKEIQPDAIFYLQNTFIQGVKVPQIAYMDQPVPFQTSYVFKFSVFEQRSLAVYQHIIGRLIKASCRKADWIIVQTDWMKKAISLQCHVDEQRITKIAPQVTIDTNAKHDSNFDHHSFIYPANFIYYKNHRCIVEAIKLLENQHVNSFKVTFTINNQHEFRNYAKIECVGNLTHSDIMEKLTTQTLIFPSYIESYGLPLAEARLMKAIILAADTEFSREILNDYPNAYFFNPFSPRQLAELMNKVLHGDIKKIPFVDPFSVETKGWGEVIKCILMCANKSNARN